MSPTSPAPAAAALYAQPSDVTLLNEILRPWVTSGDTKAPYVHAADLYAADPEELARRFPPAVSMDGDRTWYFLSPLRSKSPRDRRKVRAVADGAGCWHSEAAPRSVLDAGRHVGYRQSFSFMRRDAGGGADARSGWIMAEFHLHNDHDAHGGGGKVEGLVLCKMYRSPRHHHGPPAAVAAPVGVDDDVASAVSLTTETTSFSCVKQSRAANGDEDNSSNAAMTPARWHRDTAHTDGAATAMTAAAPLVENDEEKAAAGDDEVSGATTALCAKNDAAAADDEDCLVASPPACKKRRVDVDVAHADESPGAALPLRSTAEAQLHCPQCGFHLAALQALVTLTKTTSDSVLPLGDIADSEILSRRQRNGTRIIIG